MGYWTELERLKFGVLENMVSNKFDEWAPLEGDKQLQTFKRVLYSSINYGNWLYIISNLKTNGFLDDNSYITEKGKGVVSHKGFKFLDKLKDVDLFGVRTHYIIQDVCKS